jgi:hypothetical protein
LLSDAGVSWRGWRKRLRRLLFATELARRT